jgi:hypothetical protein
MAILHPDVEQAIHAVNPSDERRADVMLATHGILEPEQRQAIEGIDGSVHTVAGDVVTVNLPVRSLAALCELNFVKYVELSSALWLEEK